jgi:transketolase
MSDLRQMFFYEMCELASKDERIILITGDLGYSFCEKYQTLFPAQFLNVGCAEQTMIGLAAGMAVAGKKPYVYSGAIFLLMRPYEQVRDDIAYNNLNVKLIGTGASGFLGFTHNLGKLESESYLFFGLPNIKQEYPKNEDDLKRALSLDGPLYIRI